MATDWAEKESELIELWRQYPCLWKLTDKNYSARAQKVAAGEALANHFNTTGKNDYMQASYKEFVL